MQTNLIGAGCLRSRHMKIMPREEGKRYGLVYYQSCTGGEAVNV